LQREDVTFLAEFRGVRGRRIDAILRQTSKFLGVIKLHRAGAGIGHQVTAKFLRQSGQTLLISDRVFLSASESSAPLRVKVRSRCSCRLCDSVSSCGVTALMRSYNAEFW